MVKSFENLFIWQEARILVNCIYHMMENQKDYGFRDQIQRAAVSIMNNIAEGFDSGSDAKFSNFLDISKGSCSEVRSMLYLCEDLGICDNEQRAELQLKSKQISAGITNLISHLHKDTKE